MHLVDHARAHIEKTYRRPLARPAAAHRAAARSCPIPSCSGRRCSPRCWRSRSRPLLALFGSSRSPPCSAWRRGACRAARARRRSVFPAAGPRRGRVALLSGCVANALAPDINDAAIRVLTRHGFEVVLATRRRLLRLARPSHGPRNARRVRAARRNIDAWIARNRRRGTRRHPDHGIGMRHHHEGLRLHAAQPIRAMPAKAARVVRNDPGYF